MSKEVKKEEKEKKVKKSDHNIEDKMLSKNRKEIEISGYDPIYLKQGNLNVMHEPLYLYKIDKTVYGIFVNYRDSFKDKEILKATLLFYDEDERKKGNFTVHFDLPEEEKEFLNRKLESDSFNSILKKKYMFTKNLISKVIESSEIFDDFGEPSKLSISELNNKYQEILDLKNIFTKFDQREVDIVNNFSDKDLTLNEMIKQLNIMLDSIDKMIEAKQNINKKVIPIVIVVVIFLLLIIFGNSNDGGSSSSDNGYSSSCYTNSKGQTCCTSCKRTSYGDIGCGTTCN